MSIINGYGEELDFNKRIDEITYLSDGDKKLVREEFNKRSKDKNYIEKLKLLPEIVQEKFPVKRQQWIDKSTEERIKEQKRSNERQRQRLFEIKEEEKKKIRGGSVRAR